MLNYVFAHDTTCGEILGDVIYDNTHRSISNAADFRFSFSRSLSPFVTASGSSSAVAVVVAIDDLPSYT